MKGRLIKRILGLALALLMCFGNSFTFEAAAEVKKFGGKTDSRSTDFEISDEGVLCLKEGADLTGKLVLPEELDGVSVKAIGDYAFFGCREITELVLPAGVESIGDYAFCSCDGLEEIYIPDSLVSIGDSTFEGCGSLRELTVPDSVLYMGERVLENCGQLISVELPYLNCTLSGKNPYLSLGSCEKLRDVYISLLGEDFYNEALFNLPAKGGFNIHMGESPSGRSKAETNDACFYITSKGVLFAKYLKDAQLRGDVTIPETVDGVSVRALGPEAFAYQYDIKSLALPEGITEIGDYAFSSCPAELIELPDSLRRIGFAALEPKQLEGISIPAGVEKLNNPCAFMPGAKPVEIDYRGTVEQWSDIEFPLPEGSIVHAKDADAEQVFEGDFYISPGGIVSVRESSREALHGDVNIPEKIGGISVRAIGDFSRLDAKSVQIPDSVELILPNAFSNGKLQSVSLPKNLKSIGDRAFYACRDLRSLSQLPASMEHLGVAAFSGCRALSDIDFIADFPYISEGCFEGCELLKLDIPEGVRHIGKEAFADCRLLSARIPEGVKSLGAYTFSCFHLDNTEFDTMYLPGSLEYMAAALSYAPLADIFFSGSREQWAALCAADMAKAEKGGFFPNDCAIHFISKPDDGKPEDKPSKSAGLSPIVDVAGSYDFTLALREDGTVSLYGETEFDSDTVEGWTDIVALSAAWNSILGLKKDGTVLAVGENKDMLNEVSKWKNVKQVGVYCDSPGLWYFALDRGNRLCGYEGEWGSGPVLEVDMVEDFHCSTWVTIARLTDGSMYLDGQDEELLKDDVSRWGDTVDFIAVDSAAIGLNKDGSLSFAGIACFNEARSWRGIKKIFSDGNILVGIKEDGSVCYDFFQDEYCKFDIKPLDNWRDIDRVAVCGSHIVGLKTDGSVVSTGSNDCGQLDIEW